MQLVHRTAQHFDRTGKIGKTDSPRFGRFKDAIENPVKSYRNWRYERLISREKDIYDQLKHLRRLTREANSPIAVKEFVRPWQIAARMASYATLGIFIYTFFDACIDFKPWKVLAVLGALELDRIFYNVKSRMLNDERHILDIGIEVIRERISELIGKERRIIQRMHKLAHQH